MNEKRIAELRALADAAMPGPWEEDGDTVWWCHAEVAEDGVTTYNDCDIVCEVWSLRPETTQLIAAARTAIPELLDEVERLRGWFNLLARYNDGHVSYYKDMHIVSAVDAAVTGSPVPDQSEDE